jgi:hypothetical protein
MPKCQTISSVNSRTNIMPAIAASTGIWIRSAIPVDAGPDPVVEDGVPDGDPDVELAEVVLDTK